MCGIAGFNFSDKEKLKELTDSLFHRGPDQEGYFIDNNVSLGHRRLSIIDLSERGRQPMKSNDERYVIIFNGEIFNFLELKKDLKEYNFNSKTDTEVVLYAYIKWGAECVKKFNGQFAFCIYDKNKKELFLARDRLGIKPLYYYFDNKNFIFGSELKIILKSNMEKMVDSNVLHSYFILGYIPNEKSIIKNAFKLTPGCYLRFDLEKRAIIEKKRYWHNSFENNINYSIEELKNIIYKKLEESVKKRLIADVPIGAFLSGGVDSSIIVYFMQKYVKDLKTFSIGFDHASYNESKWAGMISKKFNTDHYEIPFTAKDIGEYIPRLVYSFDEPFGDSSMIPTYLVSNVASRYVKVCLSGTGGDELFVGYDRYQRFFIRKKIINLPKILRNLFIYLYAIRDKQGAKRFGQIAKNSNSDDIYIYLRPGLPFCENKEDIFDIKKIDILKSYFNDGKDLINMLNFDQNEYLPNDLLVKEDRATMANGLEGRVPFLDHELVELINKISIKIKFKYFQKKYLLKKIFEDKLPKEILYRKKIGFGVPLKYYIKNELKEFMHDNIFTDITYKFYDLSLIKTIWDDHQECMEDNSEFLWRILMFNLWYNQWIA